MGPARAGAVAPRLADDAASIAEIGLHSRCTGVVDHGVDLTQCPYDGTQLDVEVTPGGWLLLLCGACDAVWETHGGWIGRVRSPNRAKVIAARQGTLPDSTGERSVPLPKTHATSRGGETPTPGR